MSEQATSPENSPMVAVQRIYTKDLSFETPNTPHIFTAEWKPEVDINLDVNTDKLADDEYEVVLKITITAKLEKKPAFLVEVNQAGIFTLKNFPEDQLKAMLGSFCPDVLFPYARETVSSLVNRGSFPPLYLAPVDFNALYQQQLEEKDKAN